MNQSAPHFTPESKTTSTSVVKVQPLIPPNSYDQNLKQEETKPLLEAGVSIDGKASFSGRLPVVFVRRTLLGVGVSVAACYIGVQLTAQVQVQVRGSADVNAEVSTPALLNK